MTDSNRSTVLVVDDTPDNLLLINGILSDRYNVKVATNGAKTLRIARSDNPPDLILLDIVMSGMDGYEVCRQLKCDARTRNIPVIFLTVRAEVEDEKRGLELGAADYITKPISPPIVMARVRTHLDLKAAADSLRDKNQFLKSLNDQLETLNSTLQLRIDAALVELRLKDQLMIAQSRQAAMGEMIGNIAHQWRQPLNALSMVLGNIQLADKYNELTTGFINEAVDKANHLIQKMSATINDFRNFFQPDKEAVLFSVGNQINHALALVEAGLKSQNITIHLEAHQDVVLTGFPNEFSQVMLNLLSNAGEAVKAKCVAEGIITLRVFERDGLGCVSIRDNGGGIAVDVIDKIFEPYFSTKEMGTGIGLYMSKMIIERSMNGTIEAHNIDGGAEFVVSIPLGTAAL